MVNKIPEGPLDAGSVLENNSLGEVREVSDFFSDKVFHYLQQNIISSETITILENNSLGEVNEYGPLQDSKNFIDGNLEVLKLIFGENLLIQTEEDLEELFKNPNINQFLYLFEVGYPENLELIFGENGLIQTKEDLTALLKNPNIIELMISVLGKLNKARGILILKKAWEIKSEKELKKILKNPYISEVLELFEKIIYLIEHSKLEKN